MLRGSSWSLSRWVLLGAVLLHTSAAGAAPWLASVFPFSCQSGKSVIVTVAGNELGNVQTLAFSARGMTATRLEDGRFRVTAAPELEPRECDVWCLVDGQLTNPRRFVISSHPAVEETAGNDAPEQAQTVPVPGAIDARLEVAAKLDWFQFAGRAGQSVTIRCRSRTLDGSVEPTITLFDPDGREMAHSRGQRREPILTEMLRRDGLYGIRVADRAYRKADDSYYRLELQTGPRPLAVYPDLVQRDHQFQVSVYGHGLAGGVDTSLTLLGSSAPLQALTRTTTADFPTTPAWQAVPGLFPARHARGTDEISSEILSTGPFRYTDWPVTLEEEDEDRTNSARVAQALRFQTVALPAMICGRFAQRGDVDGYAFYVSEGESLQIDLYGDRLGHEMDLDAVLLNESGATVTTFPDAGAPKDAPAVLSFESLDVSASWKTPADGMYRLVVRDLYGSSLYGADRTYVLHVRHSRPAFRVIVLPPDEKTPAGYAVPVGGKMELRIHVDRQDGFAEPIRVRMADAHSANGMPHPVTLDECRIAAKETTGVATVRAAAEAAGGIHFLHLVGELDPPEDEPPVRINARTAVLLRPGSSAARFADTLAIGVIRASGEP